MTRRFLCLFLTLCLMLPLAVSAASLTTAEKNANKQAIYSYLVNTLGCSTATACGILANIEAESGYDPTAYNPDTNKLGSYGLCQWNGPRNTNLRDYCTQRNLDYTSVGAQLQFLSYELKHDEAAAWKSMQGFPNTSEGAYNAAYTWASAFERCSPTYFTQRAERAKAIFKEYDGKDANTYSVTSTKDLLNNVVNYKTGQFPDVTTQWFEPYVGTSVRKGLITGNPEGTFNPKNCVTLAETITMACRIYSRYHGDGEKFVPYGNHWYQVYLDYAYARQLIDAQTYASKEQTAAVNRSKFVQILAKTLPDSALSAINRVSSGSIPDVSASASYSTAVYKLYKAGVLTGDIGGARQFHPNTSIQRSEASAILARLVVPAQRQSFSM